MKKVNEARGQIGPVFGRGFFALAAALLLACILVACGSSDDDAGGAAVADESTEAVSESTEEASEGLPPTIPVAYVGDVTGPAASVGAENTRGMELALAAAEERGTLGDSKIELTITDSAGDPRKGTTLTSRAASSDAIAMFSPAISSVGLATAPIAQREGLPYIAIQNNASELLDTGEFIHRGSPQPSEFSYLAAQHLVDEHDVKTVALLVANDNPAQLDAAAKYREAFEERGVEVVDEVGQPTTTTDYSASATRLADLDVDAIGVLVIAANNATAVTALRRAGFEGEIFATNGAAGGFLEAAGDAAEGVIYPVAFGPGMEFESSQEFEQRYRDAYSGDAPTLYAAEGYAAMEVLINALAESQNATREGVIEGLRALAESDGFDTSLGRIGFGEPGGRQLTAPGVLIEWSNGAEEVIAYGEN